MPPAASQYIFDATDENFDSFVVEASDRVPVVLDFWSPTCQPCLRLGPVLERLIKERKGAILLVKINVDQAQQVAAYFQISGIPDIKVIYRRQLLTEFRGVLPEPELRRFLDQVMAAVAPPEDKALRQAQAAEGAAPNRAEKQYREMLAKDPENADARLGLARALLAQTKTGEIAEILEPLGASGENGQKAQSILARLKLLQLAGELPDEQTLRQSVQKEAKNAQVRLDLGILLAARGDCEEALPLLLAAADLDFKLANGKAREAMVQTFHVIGDNDPLSNEYRAKLARLLY